MDLIVELERFCKENKFRGKGPLSVALIVTQHAKKGLPLDPKELITESETQVIGLSGPAVSEVLKRHGIIRKFASEGGRTSRGSVVKMRKYVEFLNQVSEVNVIDLESIEVFWINRVHEFFAAKPLKISLDNSNSLRTLVRDLVSQAKERQRDGRGMQYVGAVLQHLVGAKLDCVLGIDSLEHNSFSTSDEQSGRVGDFLIGDVAIHVTTAPTEALINRCLDNLKDGHRPVIVTTEQGHSLAQGLAANASLGDRIDVFEIEQFLALNIYELGKFSTDGRRIAVRDVLSRYNEIIEDVETDPSLKIELR